MHQSVDFYLSMTRKEEIRCLEGAVHTRGRRVENYFSPIYTVWLKKRLFHHTQKNVFIISLIAYFDPEKPSSGDT